MKISEIKKEEIEKSIDQVIGAKYNNKYVRLDYEVEGDGKIELITTKETQGMRIYFRTLIFIMGKAFEEIYPQAKLRVNYQLANSMYCEIDNMEVTEEMLEKVKNKMKEIIEKDLPIEEKILTRQEAENKILEDWKQLKKALIQQMFI